MTAPRYPVLLAAVEIVEGVNDTLSYVAHPSESDGTLTIPPGTYYLRGDGASDDLLAGLFTAFAGFMTGAVRFGVDAGAPSGVVELEIDDAAFANDTSLELTAESTFDVGLLGMTFPVLFNKASDPPRVANSESSPSCVWVSNEPYTSIETDPSVEATQHRTPAGKVYTFIASDEFHERDLVMDLVAAARARRERNPEDPAATLESWWALARDGRPLEFHLQSIASGSTLDALSSSTLIGRYVLGLESIRRPPVTLRELAQALYTARLKLLGYVP